MARKVQSQPKRVVVAAPRVQRLHVTCLQIEPYDGGAGSPPQSQLAAVLVHARVGNHQEVIFAVTTVCQEEVAARLLAVLGDQTQVRRHAFVQAAQKLGD